MPAFSSLLSLSLLALFPCLGTALHIDPVPTLHMPINSIHFSVPIPSTTPIPVPVSTSSTVSVSTSSPTCIVNANNAATTLNMSFVELDPSTGKLLTVYVGQVVAKPGASTPIKSSLSLSIYLGSEELFTNNGFIFQNSTAGGTINWGALTENPHTVSFTVDTNNVTTGAIDGKSFSPLYVGHNTSAAELERRGEIEPLLQITPLPALNISIESLQASITKGMQSCQSELNTYYAPNNISNSIVVPRDDRTQDPGHFSNTYGASSCVNCEILATVGVGLIEAGCIAATCWWSFGIGCAVCYAAAATGEFFALAGCNFSGACCPLTCGHGSFPTDAPTCCFGDETCLNAGPGRCCSLGQQPCLGKECCNSDQSCISAGAQQGTCCPQGSTCGQNCCPSSTDVCLGNSVCCDPTDVCGETDGVCCNPINPLDSSPSLITYHCADPSRRLCCITGTVAVDGICCQSGAINCNGQCCFGTCNADGTCQNQITNAECQAMSYLGTCASIPGCLLNDGPDACAANGCCYNIPK